MHGCGNDYVYVDAGQVNIDDPSSLALEMSDRHFGVGSDGLILVEALEGRTPDADLDMRMFNADGGEAELCGNGVRCACKFAYDRNMCRANPMRIRTGCGIVEARYEVGARGLVSAVTVDLGEPILEVEKIPVHISMGPVVDHPVEALLPGDLPASGGLDPRMTCVSMGNPHAVLFAADVDLVPLEHLGPMLGAVASGPPGPAGGAGSGRGAAGAGRDADGSALFPRGANVHIVQVVNGAEVRMRSWERGSGLTLACGSGAAATVVAGVLSGRTGRDLTIHVPGGTLKSRWDQATNRVHLSGPTVEVFTGRWGK